MRDATTFPDAEAALIAAIKAPKPTRYVSDVTPSPIPAEAIIVGFSGGGFREWGEAAVNAGINVYALTDARCRTLVREVQDDLAATSNDLIQSVSVPAGGATSVPRQTPPFQRYFAVTAYLRGQATL